MEYTMWTNFQNLKHPVFDNVKKIPDAVKGFNCFDNIFPFYWTHESRPWG